MAKQSIGYLLPPGDAYESDLQCMILFYPDRKEYRQALFGSLDYLATWLAWEKEPDKKGKDAARSWRAAVLATRECIEMGTCDTILELLTLIEANTRACWCPGDEDITDGDQFTDVVVDEVGDVPQNIIDAGYAEDAEDWEGFADYKCMISHLMITNMEWQLREILPHLDSTGIVIGGVATIAAVLGVIFASGGLALVLGMIASVAASATIVTYLADLTDSGLETLADGVSENHDELACAIFNADGSAGAVIDLKTKIDILFNPLDGAVLKNLNLDAQLKALYSGRYDQQDIAQLLDDNGLETGDFECQCYPLWYLIEGGFDEGFDNMSNPCQFDSLVLSDRDRVKVHINYDGVDYQGPMRVISEASITPSGNVSRVKVLNQLGQTTYDSGLTVCAVDISVLDGKTAAFIHVSRLHGDCSEDWFDLTIELE